MVVPVLAAKMEQLGVPGVAVDSRHVIATTADRLNAEIVFDATRHRAGTTLLPLLQDGFVPVMTGYLGSYHADEVTGDLSDFGKPGETNLVGSGGSDYIATGTAAAIGARRALLMKGPMRGNVAGVFTADPREDEHAALITRMPYQDAIGFEGRVLHPRAAEPLMQDKIPLWVLSLSASERQPNDPPGTVIYDTNRGSQRQIGGIEL